METEMRTSFKILMFPWLAHGHIFPFLELAKGILKRKNFYIYLCTTSINFPSINNFIRKNMLQDSIELVEFHLEPFPELPPHYHTTKDLPSDLNPTLHKAFQASKSSFFDIINSIKPDLVVYDLLQPWASTHASVQGIPAVYFSICSTATHAYIHHQYACSKDAHFPFQELCLSDYENKSLGDMIGFLIPNVFDDDKDSIFTNFKFSCDYVLFKTTRAFEGKYIDYVSSQRQKEFVVVGPLVSDPNNNIDMEDSEIMQWLGKKDESSTVYISFGSESFLSKQEIEEIAKGLELCDHRVNFIWVIRFPLGDKPTNIEDVLPEGFLERVKGRGIVVEGWAPQANILSHKNIGGFISHCGWSSIMESLHYGVPVIGMPLKINMFIDARRFVEAGACLEVSRDENNVYKGEEIAKTINKVVVEKSTGEGMRNRARELGEMMKMEEQPALDEAAEKLWQLCSKNKL